MSETYYGMKAVHSEEQKDTVAKMLEMPELGMSGYYVKVHRGKIVNPNDSNFKLLRQSEIKWHKVSAEVFQNYLRFLDSGIERFLSYANWGM